MESTGVRNKIQLSQETADLISAQPRKDIWVEPRKEAVVAKGKGELSTHFLVYRLGGGTTISADSAISSDVGQNTFGSLTGVTSKRGNNNDDGQASAGTGAGIETKTESDAHSQSLLSDGSGSENVYETAALRSVNMDMQTRLVDWNVDVLAGLLQKIVSMRGAELSTASVEPQLLHSIGQGKTIQEVKETIKLPRLATQQRERGHNASATIDPKAKKQLKLFVKTIASLYNNHAFHGFEHATHVLQSVVKLLSRIVSTTDDIIVQERGDEPAVQLRMHNFTFGITSDPIIQFTCALSALVHDVDHPGVSNDTLVKLRSPDALFYGNQSVAEQKSIDVAWQLLMEPDYDELRKCIYSTQEELERFRQLIVNSVMATDIVDKELKKLRNDRWDRAFSDEIVDSSGDCIGDDSAVCDAMDRKATIVIEHLIQASDVSHTMQHWHVYKKWNERFFHECYQAFVDGHVQKDPTIGWFEGELGFFDFYIIPLAKKLKECGVFGVSSDEYISYAISNRKEWEQKGRGLVEEYKISFRKRAAAN